MPNLRVAGRSSSYSNNAANIGVPRTVGCQFSGCIAVYDLGTTR